MAPRDKTPTPTSPSLSEVDPASIAALRRRSLITTTDFRPPELAALLSVAEAFERLDRDGVRTDLLPAELAYALFFDQSTRTKSAWAGAAARLGMHPVIVDGASTQVSHGETAVETGAMLGMNAHALGVRHDKVLGEGTPFMRDMERGVRDYFEGAGLRRHVPLVSLQCDFDHPSQSLADLAYLHERFGSVAGRKIAVSWAYSPSYAKPLSVLQGLAMLLPRFGAEVVLAAPEGFPLTDAALEEARSAAEEGSGGFRVVGSMDEAFEGADVVYPSSWGALDLMLERVGVSDEEHLADIERRALERNAEHQGWICDEERMARTRDGEGLFMHCLPADIGAEVSAPVMDRFRPSLAREAQKKVFVIMALLAASKRDDVVERLLELGAG